MSSYYSHDFDLDTWIIQAINDFKLPTITEEYSENDIKHWNTFYNFHRTGQFFKPRRYLALEFSLYLNNLDNNNCSVLEVGCGYGCSMFPLLEKYQFNYIATDYSDISLTILQSNPLFTNIKSKCITNQWDITEKCPENLSSQIINTFHTIDAILCVFALSAIHPNQHILCLQNMKLLLQLNKKKNKVILFRDYGIHDMTMYRHDIRYTNELYRRNDGTLAYYFDLKYIENIVEEVGLKVLELEYATVKVLNRKQTNTMHRVFVHAVLTISDE